LNKPEIAFALSSSALFSSIAFLVSVLALSNSSLKFLAVSLNFCISLSALLLSDSDREDLSCSSTTLFLSFLSSASRLVNSPDNLDDDFSKSDNAFFACL